MYSIVEEQINGFNGLVSASKKASTTGQTKTESWNKGNLGAGGATFSNVMQALTPVITTAGQVAQTAINAKNNQNPNTNTGGTTYSPTVYVPPTGGNTTNAPTTQSKSIGDYLPWIVGGLAVLGLGYMIMKK